MRYGTFDVYINNEAVGTASVSSHGLLTCISCYVEINTKEVMRLAADVGDCYETIGVIMPDGDGFTLKKYLTKNDIYLKRLDNVHKYVIINENTPYRSHEQQQREEHVWTACKDPAALFNDGEAGTAVAACSGVITAEHEGNVYAAIPVKENEPFPPLPIFYFGQRGMLNGEEYLMFTLKNGLLQI